MPSDRFDHVFAEPASFDASCANDGDVRHAELAARGAALFAPEATHWGTRWFVARDPDGNLIAFEQRP
jgi:uncharacterized glyoxalase superfamily protein PhnB